MLVNRSKFSVPKGLRHGPPPALPKGTDSLPLDRFVHSQADEAKTESTKSPKLGLVLMGGISLLGSFTGSASAGQLAQVAEMAYTQPLEVPAKAEDLLSPNLSKSARSSLLKNMEKLPQEVIDLMADSGLVIDYAAGPEGLVKSGAVTVIDPARLKENTAEDIPQIQEFTQNLRGARQLESQVREATSGRWRIFRATNPERTDSEIDLEEMAKAHGFKSEEDVQWFIQTVDRANANTLPTARQNAINRATYESTLGGRKGRKAAARLESYQEDPTSIPVNWRHHKILVPDAHRTTIRSKPVLVSLHDLQTIPRWTKPMSPNAEKRKFLGQYFGENGQHLVLISRDGLRKSDTVIHEIGHAVEKLIERNSPDLYGGFMTRLSIAHDGIKPTGEGRNMDPDGGKHHDSSGRSQISDYSRTNAKEYFAEGFAHYFQDAGKLKRQDPTLHQLVEEGIRLAKGPELEIPL